MRPVASLGVYIATSPATLDLAHGRTAPLPHCRTAALTYIRVVRRLRKSIRMNWPRVMVLVK